MGVEAAAVKADADTDEEVEADVDLAAIAVLKARQPNRHSIQPSQVKSFFWNHLANNTADAHCVDQNCARFPCFWTVRVVLNISDAACALY